MKKRRLNERGKVLVTVLLIIFACVVWSLTPVTGALGKNNDVWFLICLVEWAYLFCGQFLLYLLVWGE